MLITMIAITLLVALLLWLGRRLVRHLRRAREEANRVFVEDALKHIRESRERGAWASVASIAGSLQIPHERAFRLVRDMERRGLLTSVREGIELTPHGSALALNVTRAHRLWEHYLSDEVGLSLDQLHAPAHVREHTLSPADADRLHARLGFPRYDPHGDHIPTAEQPADPRDTVALTAWPVGQRARVIHVEDEEPRVIAEAVARGLQPGAALDVTARNEGGIHVRTEHGESRLEPIIAAGISVEAAPATVTGVVALSTLRPGDSAIVVDLNSRGLTRRRFMDLGLVPGTRIEAVMPAVFGEPVAYRFRDTLIALRREQADQILVRPDEGNEDMTGTSGEGTA